jgi:hypothetical protein
VGHHKQSAPRLKTLEFFVRLAQLVRLAIVAARVIQYPRQLAIFWIANKTKKW